MAPAACFPTRRSDRSSGDRGKLRNVKLLLKNLAFTVLVPGTVAVYLPRLLIAEGAQLAAPLLAVPVFAIGLAIYVWCVWDFAAHGRGTPAPIDAPKRLVVRGLYGYSRNPMYVGVVTVIVGWALLYRSPAVVVYAAIVGTLFHLRVVLYEEPRLRELFGADYEAYCRRVGRWLPRWRRAK